MTRLLRAHRSGSHAALAELLPLLYEELRRLARGLLRAERSANTLQATALVHEAWLRLSGQESLGSEDRAAFFAAAASVMRRILVDHARARGRAKRGGGAPLADLAGLDEAVVALERDAGDLLALEEALTNLVGCDARKAQLVELRFFAGLSMREAAEVMAVSERQAERDWAMARAWLRARLDDGRSS